MTPENGTWRKPEIASQILRRVCRDGEVRMCTLEPALPQRLQGRRHAEALRQTIVHQGQLSTGWGDLPTSTDPTGQKDVSPPGLCDRSIFGGERSHRLMIQRINR